MASRKQLKKDINYIIGDLFTDCLIQNLYVPETDKEKAVEVMSRILKVQQEYVSRISHPEPGNVKNFYKKLREDFTHEVGEIINEIAKLN
ncbi:MAG: hypothetical protein LUD15_09405 [Bacteroides sp.]|nr:hypothetical protein [Bacteroides sp.]